MRAVALGLERHRFGVTALVALALLDLVTTTFGPTYLQHPGGARGA